MNRPRFVDARTLVFAGATLAAACGGATQTAPALAVPQADTAPASAAATDLGAPADAKAAQGGTPAQPGALQHAGHGAEDAVVRQLAELEHRDPQVDQHLQYLTQNIGPRLTGSHNLARAEQWARDQFAAWGLEAHLEQWGTVPVGFDRGPWSGAMVEPERVDLDFTTPAWTPGAVGPVRGQALLYPTTVAQARKLEGRAAGAWILHRRSERDLPEAMRKRIDTYLEGAAGHVHRASDSLVHTFGRYQIGWNELPRQVSIYLRGDQYDDIAKRIENGAEVALEFSIDNSFYRGPVPQHNVIADIVGSEFPDEYVIVGGHLDSWDGAEGAVDNGTGVATTLEAARLLAQLGVRPRRTIRFMLWSGEEQGLLGSEGYVKAHPDLMPKISAVLVHDGGTNFASGLSVTPEMAEDMKRVFEPLFFMSPELPFGLYLAEALSYGGSDHSSFLQAGVPGFFWHQSGRANYEHAHHTQYDTIDVAISEYQRHTAIVVAAGAWGLANLDGLLDRTGSAPLGRRRLGVNLDGTTLVEVVEDGKAAEAGLRVGDIITAVDGNAVTSTRELIRAIWGGEATKRVAVKRGKKTLEVVLDYAKDENETERVSRKQRRQEKFGEIDYGKVFAGREVPEDQQPSEQPGKAPSKPAKEN